MPDGLADGAARGTPAVRISSRATGWLGMRTATVSRPAVTMSGTVSFFRKIRVSGPGQKRLIRGRALAGISSTMSSSWSGLDTCTIKGFWGDDDGGTTSGRWDATNELVGAKAEGVPFSTPIAGLLANQTNYYRCYATNDSLRGDDWAELTSFVTLAP